MSAVEHFGPLSGPFTNVGQACQAYVGNLDVMARRFEPLAVAAARANLSLFGLMTRRAQAWLEMPTRLGQCRTPHDLVSEQLRFWQTAVHDYADATKRLTLAVGSLAAPGYVGAWGGKAATPLRDHLTFPDAKHTGGEAAKRNRRAA